jgi:hypothetical protein
MVDEQDMTLEQLKAQVKFVQRGIEEIQSNKEVRERRFHAGLAIFSLPRGAIRSDPVE